MNQIENKEQKLFRYLSRESDPRVLAQLLELLKDHGALPFDQLSLALRDRGYSLKVDKAKAVRKELEFIEWLLPEHRQMGAFEFWCDSGGHKSS